MEKIWYFILKNFYNKFWYFILKNFYNKFWYFILKNFCGEITRPHRWGKAGTVRARNTPAHRGRTPSKCTKIGGHFVQYAEIVRSCLLFAHFFKKITLKRYFSSKKNA